ncbi:MAG TPA: helix-turn-helix transcriptional regulator [Candidatus Angelobacter sp.]|jgi:transcriptional regulator with XRE-family HTH domain|nr:helix-turn-helix transcriptional regulator [Candidatus Angelobacter sp.]
MQDSLIVRKRIGERIRLLRKQRGWSQFQLSQKSGLGRVYTGSLERGKSAIGIDSMCKVTAALGITLSELLEGIYDPRRKKKGRASSETKTKSARPVAR